MRNLWIHILTTRSPGFRRVSTAFGARFVVRNNNTFSLNRDSEISILNCIDFCDSAVRYLLTGTHPTIQNYGYEIRDLSELFLAEHGAK